MWYTMNNVVYSGVLLGHEKEGHPATHNMMETDNIMLSETSQQKTGNVWYHLYVESKKGKRIKTDSNWWLRADGVWRNRADRV